ncbi:hypothetical protein [Spirochaeta africana]|uniref:Uncharacterized protein n=1 Tax=Spirochaeta africana (strain ATCC 700263 / DSM 8902 / Z-7692) TaxID=889378 RepID=H9UHF9_SPIAZ|nr:hypothetical protein [Spirochaeta africana]AFG36952.1 hypothetical protein Spiaf_0861 [Spirochaeta africana DSM 8902]
MKTTNHNNLEQRFEDDQPVIDYFDTQMVLSINRLADLAGILNLSAIAREAGINIQTLQAKIRRRTPLTGTETKAILQVLRKHHLATVA